MYLVVYTRKRLIPLIRKIPLLVLLSAPAVPLALAGAAIYFLIASAALEQQAAGLKREIFTTRAQLAAADSIPGASATLAPALRSTPAEILIDLRTPAGGDTVPTAQEGGGGVYAVQISSHRNRREAVQVVAELAGRLSRPVLIRQTVLANGGWYRVLIEPFESRTAATDYADSLQAVGVIGEFILHRLPSGWREDLVLENPATN